MVDLKRKGKPKKIQCEICGEKDESTLHRHHIVERTEINTDHSYWNLAVLCSNCHNKVHHGDLKIIGIYPSTDPIMGRTVIYEENGVNDSGITEPYYIPKPKSMRWHGAEKAKGSEQED